MSATAWSGDAARKRLEPCADPSLARRRRKPTLEPGTSMTSDYVSRVKRDPQFQELVAKRSRFAWTLSAAMLVIYFGFIFIIAFAPKTLGVPLAAGAVTTVGIPLGLFVIVAAFVLTGIYVYRANSEFDAITQAIIERAK
jgi:uncharacterized membrane protein (DUF485 family)